MAYTKIHAVTATVNKAIKYICNADKTDESLLISSFGCSPETAAFDFKFALSKTCQSDKNKAYHLIQSFLPGEVSSKEAHRIGTELADRLLEGKYSYIVSTHIDKGHVHNHIIFCAADNIDHAKYHDCKKTYYNIRRLSDALCREHHLSVISPDGERGKKYNEWQAQRNGTAWKTKLKADIDEAINDAENYGEWIALIRAKGYEIKGEALADTDRSCTDRSAPSSSESIYKYISFRPLDRERFVRGSIRSLGADYTKERIAERIMEKRIQKEKGNRLPHQTTQFPKKKKSIIQNLSGRPLIDTTGEKFTESPGLKHWADVQNLKIAAASYSSIGSISELEKEIGSKTKIAKTARSGLVETEHRMKDLAQIIKYAEQYNANHIYHVRYLKSKDKEAYFRRREMELILHDGAEDMLKRFGINPKTMDIEKLRREYDVLRSKKEHLQQTCRTTEKELSALKRKMENINHYLGRIPDAHPIDTVKKKSTQTL